MGDYSNMASYYDVIMTSGYYDYAKIVDNLVLQDNVEKVLEIGCGTGLILEELARRKSNLQISGIDLTAPMLDIAKQRLQPFKNVDLSQQNVCHLSLGSAYDLTFSYGGVWYFVIDGDKEPFMVSHIADHELNVKGLKQLALQRFNLGVIHRSRPQFRKQRRFRQFLDFLGCKVRQKLGGDRNRCRL